MALTYREALKGISAYPIPARTLEAVAARRHLPLDYVPTAPESFLDPAYRLSLADLMAWLVMAPNVSQGGQSYSLSSSEREALRRSAQAIYEELGEEDTPLAGVQWGYMGSRL